MAFRNFQGILSTFKNVNKLLLYILLILGHTISSEAQDQGKGNPYEEILKLMENKAFQEALHQLEKKEDSGPKSADHLAIKAFLLARLGEDRKSKEEKQEQFARGKALAEQAIEREPDHAFAHFALAISLGLLIEDASPSVKLEYAEGIKKAAEKAIEEDPTLAGPHHVLGRWHLNLAQLSTLQRWSIGFFYEGFSEASYEKAIEHFEKAASINPEESVHYYQMGLTYRKMGKEEKGEEKVVKALELAQSNGNDKVVQQAREFLGKG